MKHKSPQPSLLKTPKRKLIAGLISILVTAVGLFIAIGQSGSPEAPAVNSAQPSTSSLSTTPASHNGGFVSGYKAPLVCTGRDIVHYSTGPGDPNLVKPIFTEEISNLNTRKLYTVIYSDTLDADNDVVKSNFVVAEGVDGSVPFTPVPRTDTNVMIVDITGTNLKSLDANSAHEILKVDGSATVPDEQMMDCASYKWAKYGIAAGANPDNN